MDDLTLRVNDNKEVVSVETVENEVPISSAELQRQIDQHQAIIDDLKTKQAYVQQFEEDNSEELALVVEEEVINEGVEDNE